jgi:FkbH-like protein
LNSLEELEGHLAQGNVDKAEESLFALASLSRATEVLAFSHLVSKVLEVARLWEQRGCIKEAISCLNNFLDAFPGNKRQLREVFIRLSNLYKNEGDTQKASLAIKSALKAFPDDLGLWKNLIGQLGDSEALEELIFSMLEEVPTPSAYRLAHRALTQMDAGRKESPSRKEVRVALLCSFTMDTFIHYLEVHIRQLGLDPVVWLAPFDQVKQMILDSESELYRFKPGIVFIVIHGPALRPSLFEDPFALSEFGRREEISGVGEELATLLDKLEERSEALIVVHNVVPPVRSPLGIADWKDPLGMEAIVQEVNGAIAEVCRRSARRTVFDYHRFCREWGLRHCQDERLAFLADMQIAERVFPQLAREYCRIIAAAKGLTRKCVVVDLDNTLWGGIVGEDGFEGIELGDFPPGNVYKAFQLELKKLLQRGIILAINSKNNEDEALRVLTDHPHMVLRPSDFASMRINWLDKVTNMKSIADELNIGLDSFVFIDDSPVERDMVKSLLPEVYTMDLPPDPVKYIEALRNIIVLEPFYVTEEDRQRTKLYQQQVARQRLERSCETLEEFWAQLEMVATIQRADEFSIPRIAQLVQRTNQFNLTTYRYSHGEIAEMAQAKDVHIWHLRLEDKFGDNGIVGVMIVRKHESQWIIDSFLMSCRVLGRTVETAFLAFVAQEARNAGIKRLIGCYRPTKKNRQVEDFYPRHEFESIGEQDGTHKFILDLEKKTVPSPPWVSVKT